MCRGSARGGALSRRRRRRPVGSARGQNALRGSRKTAWLMSAVARTSANATGARRDIREARRADLPNPRDRARPPPPPPPPKPTVCPYVPQRPRSAAPVRSVVVGEERFRLLRIRLREQRPASSAPSEAAASPSRGLGRGCSRERRASRDASRRARSRRRSRLLASRLNECHLRERAEGHGDEGHEGHEQGLVEGRVVRAHLVRQLGREGDDAERQKRRPADALDPPAGHAELAREPKLEGGRRVTRHGDWRPPGTHGRARVRGGEGGTRIRRRKHFPFSGRACERVRVSTSERRARAGELRGVRRRPRGERALPGVGRDATAARPSARRRAPTGVADIMAHSPRRAPWSLPHRRVARWMASVRRGVRREVPLELEAATTRRARALVVQPRGAHRGETNVAARARGPGGEPERTTFDGRDDREALDAKNDALGFSDDDEARAAFAARRARRDATDVERVRGRLRRGRHREFGFVFPRTRSRRTNERRHDDAERDEKTRTQKTLANAFTKRKALSALGGSSWWASLPTQTSPPPPSRRRRARRTPRIAVEARRPQKKKPHRGASGEHPAACCLRTRREKKTRSETTRRRRRRRRRCRRAARDDRKRRRRRPR